MVCLLMTERLYVRMSTMIPHSNLGCLSVHNLMQALACPKWDTLVFVVECDPSLCYLLVSCVVFEFLPSKHHSCYKSLASYFLFRLLSSLRLLFRYWDICDINLGVWHVISQCWYRWNCIWLRPSHVPSSLKNDDNNVSFPNLLEKYKWLFCLGGDF